MPSWTDIKARWSTGWQELHRQTVAKLGSAIKRNPESFRPQVTATLTDLQAARAHLQRIQARLPQIKDEATRAKAARAFAALYQRYHVLAAGIYADDEQARAEKAAQARSGQAQVSGFIVPLLIIGGIVLGVAAIAWAIASREHAKNLRDQTALADHELTARVEASKEGRVLQETTLPEQPQSAPLLSATAPDVGGGGTGAKVGLALVGVLALVAAGVALPMFLKR